MARAIFGEVEISFSWQAQHVLKLREIAGARNVNVSIHTKCATKMGRVTSPNQRVRDGDFILGLSWECRRIVYLVAEAIDGLFGQIFHAGFDGRRSIW